MEGALKASPRFVDGVKPVVSKRIYPLPKPYGEYLLVRPHFDDDDMQLRALWLPQTRRKALPSSGTVLAVGPEVRGLRPGEDVLWISDSVEVTKETAQRIDESLFFVHQAIVVATLEEDGSD